MKINASKIMFTLFGVFIAAFLVVTVFNFFYSPFETEIAREMTVEESIEAPAVAVRDERVITSDQSGVAVYAVENGGKVAKGAAVVSYYSDADSAAKKIQIDRLSGKIKRLTDIYTQNGNYAADLDIVADSASANLLSMLENVENGNLSAAGGYADELFYDMCRAGAATGRITDIIPRTDELKTSLDSLKKGYKQSESTAVSDYSGYFVNVTDGYESAISFENISELTVDDFDKIKPAAVDKNAVGRVVCDTGWYLAAKVDLAAAKEITEGGRVSVALPIGGFERLSATVTAVNADRSKNQAVVVLNCTNMSGELAMIRRQDIRIIVKTHTGLRVSKKAVRVVDGVRGVYVSINGIRRFCATDIVYSGEEFVIVDTDNSSGKLRIYDDVIVSS
ncbi:MAG: HlyD family efflux transporter periplasmic adaptor subunit [Acutalibacteraceae bacterium]